jgi:outer membrane protein assembly factor BamD
MNKLLKRLRKAGIIILLIGTYCTLFVGVMFAYWEWTPERGKWINPKYYVGETSSEQWEIAMDYYKVEDYETASREFKKLVEHFPDSKEAPEAQFMIGDCLEKLGFLYEACQSYQKVIEKYPSTDRFKEIAERQKRIADYFYTRQSSDESITDKARELFTLSKCEKAANIYKMVIKNYPYYEKADEAQYRIADCYMQMKKYEIARIEFDKVSSQYPDSPLIDDAEYQKGICWSKESTRFPNSEQLFEKAIKSFEEFIARYPESEFVDEAKEELENLNNRKSEKIYQVAKFYEKSGDMNAAKIYYQQVIEQFPNSMWAGISKSRLDIILKNENQN